jgi:S-methylmethionine-dependent homocysteine/selenocysteine methylase
VSHYFYFSSLPLPRLSLGKNSFSFSSTGSLPPLQESYQVYTHHNTTAEQRKEFEEEYIALATAIAPFVDIFLFETLSSITEALLASRAAHAVHKKYPTKSWWISFTLEDSERAVLRSGEPLEQAAQAVVENFPENNLEAILINCCAPAAVTAGLKVLNCVTTLKEKGIKIGGYANGFKTTTSEWLESEATASLPESSSLPSTTSSNDGKNQRERTTQLMTLPDEEYDAQGIILPEAYLKHARQWRRSQECGGASIIGGCCGVGPEHIALLRSQLL